MNFGQGTYGSIEYGGSLGGILILVPVILAEELVLALGWNFSRYIMEEQPEITVELGWNVNRYKMQGEINEEMVLQRNDINKNIKLQV